MTLGELEEPAVEPEEAPEAAIEPGSMPSPRRMPLDPQSRIALERLAEAIEQRQGPAKRTRDPGVPRFNQILLARVALTAAILAGGAVAVIAMFVLEPEMGFRSEPAGRPVEEQKLVRQLETLKSAWNRPDRERMVLIAVAGGASTSLRPLLDPDHALAEQAAEVAGAALDPAHHLALVNLAYNGASGARAKAIEAAEKLEPWSVEDLTGFLRAADEHVILAALRVCKGRPDAPCPEIVRILTEFAGDLRQAAIAAVPPAPNPEFAAAIWELVADAADARRIPGLQALRRTVTSTDDEVRIAALLPLLSPVAQLAALDVLGQRPALSGGLAAVHALADKSQAQPMVRARAIHCLEQTISFDAQHLVDQLFFVDPLSCYLTARCLVTVADTRGIDLLLELGFSDDPKNASVGLLSKQLLGWLTGLSAGSPRESFETAMQQRLDTLGRRALPELRLDFQLDAGPR
jgi:hypothetical protein